MRRRKLIVVFYSAMALFFLGCNSEDASDCFQNAGDLQQVEVALPNFTKITVFEQLNLVLKQGSEQKVVIESGEYLLNEISAEVEEGRLIVQNENGCNLLRDYALSTVYVTAPNIEEIRSSTGLTISSDGVLSYPTLRLVSESFINPDTETTDGSFELDLNTTTVSIVVNGIAYFNLKGNSTNLDITVAAGDTRIEAQELITTNVNLNHRGSNDILVNPQERLIGVIRGYGDVLSFNRPETVRVTEEFRGKLIFKD